MMCNLNLYVIHDMQNLDTSIVMDDWLLVLSAFPQNFQLRENHAEKSDDEKGKFIKYGARSSSSIIADAVF